MRLMTICEVTDQERHGRVLDAFCGLIFMQVRKLKVCQSEMLIMHKVRTHCLPAFSCSISHLSNSGLLKIIQIAGHAATHL